MKLYLALLLAVTFAAYSRSFYVPFVYDDSYAIAKNPGVNGTAPISIHGPRSVLYTTFRLNYFFGGTDVLGYHVVNFALHLSNVLILFALLSAIGLSSIAALSGAAFFALHPLQSEAVIYISARSELLSCCFGLMGMLLFERKRYVWASLALLFALYSKEIAIVFLLMIGLRLLMHRRDSWIMWKHLLPIVLLGLTVSVWFSRRLETSGRGFSEFFLLQSGQLVRFLRMILIPTGQTLDHDAETLPWAICVASVAVLIALCLIAWMARVDYPIITLGIGWLLIAVLPRFVIVIPEFMQELHFYTPMIGVSLLFAQIFNMKEIYVATETQNQEVIA